MTLANLLAHLDVVESHGDTAIEIAGLAYDSRRAAPGDLFFALPGQHHDGGAFVAQALAAGAVAAVGEHAARGETPYVRVPEARKALAQAAAAFHGHPARALGVVGVTGTKGKTTITYLLESIFEASGRSSGIIGTTGWRIAGRSHPGALTTPESPELQALLREMAEAGVRAVALEISSHALVQRRAFGLDCDVVVFSNLGRDHLDYHGTAADYLDAKLMLFDGRNADRPVKHAVAVINADDAVADQVIAAARRGGLAVRTYGGIGADVAIGAVTAQSRGLRFTLVDEGVERAVSMPLLGRHNAWNAAAAYAAARALEIAPEEAVRGLESIAQVPGRLERVPNRRGFEVVVDYAHTPESLAAAIAAAREHARGRVLLVFGCGGDRDAGKRPLMGEAAAAGSDLAWVTNDNPRGEDPEAIAADIVRGAPAGALEVELDRRAAIARALEQARAGDVVLIAGKGHETTQTIGDRVLPFDDRDVARALLGDAAEGR